MKSTDPPIFADADCPKRRPTCHERVVGEEKVVYDSQSHQVVVLNRTASFILDRCDGEHTVGSLLELLKERFAAAPDVLRDDLMRTLSELHSKSIVS